MLQRKAQVSSSARRKACGQERREQGAGTALVSHTAVCLSVCLSVRPPCSPASPLGAVAAARAGCFGRRFQPSPARFRSGGKAETSAGAVGEAVGMSAGDPNSALNFKCHCTKSGDTGLGSKLAQPLALSQNVCVFKKQNKRQTD